MTKTVAAICVGLVLFASARTGLCQESANPAETRSWYGYQTLLADGLAYAAIAGSLSSGSSRGVIAGYGMYLSASPIIHGVHHHPGRALTSALLRLGSSVLGFVIAQGDRDCNGDDCGIVSGMVGMGVGMLTMTLVDAVVAVDTSAAPPPRPVPVYPPQRSQASFSLSSLGVVPTPNGASIMVGGQF